VALQRQFRGLQKFLGRYEAGQMPLELGGIVSPTIDIQEWVQPEVLTNGQSIDTGQIATPGQPSEGKVFIPEWIGMHIPILATQQALNVQPVIILNNTLIYGLDNTNQSFTTTGNWYMGLKVNGLRIGDAAETIALGFSFRVVANGPITNVSTFAYGRSYTV